MNDESRPRPPSAVPKPAAGERSFLHRVALVNVMVIAFSLAWPRSGSRPTRCC
jgi:hypothetical protein